MKRGFLNTEKGKIAISRDTEALGKPPTEESATKAPLAQSQEKSPLVDPPEVQKLDVSEAGDAPSQSKGKDKIRISRSFSLLFSLKDSLNAPATTAPQPPSPDALEEESINPYFIHPMQSLHLPTQSSEPSSTSSPENPPKILNQVGLYHESIPPRPSPLSVTLGLARETMQRIITEDFPGASLNQDDYCEVFLEAGTAGEVLGCMPLPPQTQPLPVNARVRDGDDADKGKGKEGETVKMYSICATETMGLGMFARKDLSAGELVMAERPLIIIPKTPVRIETSTDEASLGQIDNEELENLRLDAFEIVMQAHLETMLPKRRTQFLALSASPPTATKGRKERLLWNRIQANAVSFPSQPVRSSVLANGDKLIGEVPQNYLAVCNDISRINHSCAPNAALSFDTKSWSFQLHTLRDVSAGTELVISYVPILLPLGERSNILGTRNFVCQCTACFPPSSDSIHFRASFAQEVAILETSYRFWLRDILAPGTLILDPALALLERADQEQLIGASDYGRLLSLIFHCFCANGDKTNTKKYQTKLFTWYMVRAPREREMYRAWADDKSGEKLLEKYPIWGAKLKLKRNAISRGDNIIAIN